MNKHIDSLTGFRWLAATLVFLYHVRPAESLGQPTTNFWLACAKIGWCGVSFFFVLSGFLLTHIYLEPFSKSSDGLRDYFIKRFSRIYPLYFTLIVAIFCYAVWLGHLKLNQWVFLDLAIYLTLLRGFFSEVSLPLSPTVWTLTVEESFYFILPFALFYLARGRAFLKLAFLAALLFGLGQLMSALNFHPYGFLSDWVNSSLLGQFSSFALGMALAILFRRKKFLFTKPLGNLCGLIALAGYAGAALYFAGRETWMEGLHGAILFGLIGAFFITSLLVDSWFARIFALPALVYGGKISYAFYLIHASFASLHKIGLNYGVIAQYLAATVLSMAAYRLIEVPAQNHLRRSLKHSEVPKI